MRRLVRFDLTSQRSEPLPGVSRSNVRSACSISLILIAAAVVGLGSKPSQALEPWADFCEDNRSFSVELEGDDWDAVLADGVRIGDAALWGYDAWSWYYQDPWGGRPIWEDYNDVYSIDVVSNAQAGGGAVTVCPGNPLGAVVGGSRKIAIGQDQYQSLLGDRKTWANTQGLLAHEVGHVLGLGHAGVWDSGPWTNWDIPTMATCLGTAGRGYAADYQSRQNLALDDVAALADVTDKNWWDPSLRNLTANNSFQDGTVFWDVWNKDGVGPDRVMWTRPGGPNGTERKGVLPQGHAMSQYNRVTRTVGNLGVGGTTISGDKFHARVNVSTGSVAGVLVALRMTYQGIDYPFDIDFGCNFWNLDKNDPTLVGGLVMTSFVYCQPSDVRHVWSWCPTNTITGSHDGAEVGVEVWNDGVDAQVGRVRVLWDY